MTTLTKRQRIQLGPKLFTERGEQYRITANVRHDDDCGNGHNTFAITCTIERKQKTRKGLGYAIIDGDWVEDSSGCLHDEFAKHFPEYAHLIKWHLSSTDGPMHYIANTVYHASDKDHNGKRAGEVATWGHGVRFGNSPITHKVKRSFSAFLEERMDTTERLRDTGCTGRHGDFQVVGIAYGGKDAFSPNYTLVGYGETWADCPFIEKNGAYEFCEALNTCEVKFVSAPLSYSKGKERDLDAARNAAVWPDATDADLTAPGLKERLEARLPQLLADFRKDVEAFGFTW